jgi:hypothetical protein
MMDELIRAAQEGILTEIQIRVTYARYSGFTYKAILSNFNLSGNATIVHCIVRTVTGRKWWPGHPGGNDSYLSEVDQSTFERILDNASNELNCISSQTAVVLSYELVNKRYKNAIQLLIQMKSEKLIEHMEVPKYPCKSWLKHFCTGKGFKLCRPQYLELLRRVYCNQNAVNAFFNDFGELFQRDQRLIFGMDETVVDSHKAFKVLCQQSDLPIAILPQKIPHITGCVTVNGMGIYFKPLIILQNKRKLGSLREFTDFSDFATSDTGWITKNIFTFWCICFIAQVQYYRLTLPEEIRDQNILLILDGHKSRINLDAAVLLAFFNITVLILPGHTTHVLQVFDISIAAPLKCFFKQTFTELTNPAIDEIIAGAPNINSKQTAEMLRYNLVEAFIDAMHRGCTKRNIQSGFKKSGIIPLNPSEPITNHLTALKEIANHDAVTAKGTVNSMILNDEDGLEILAQLQNKRSFNEDIDLDVPTIIQKMRSKSKTDGIPITDIPLIFLQEEENSNLITKISLEE